MVSKTQRRRQKRQQQHKEKQKDETKPVEDDETCDGDQHRENMNQLRQMKYMASPSQKHAKPIITNCTRQPSRSVCNISTQLIGYQYSKREEQPMMKILCQVEQKCKKVIPNALHQSDRRCLIGIIQIHRHSRNMDMNDTDQIHLHSKHMVV